MRGSFGGLGVLRFERSGSRARALRLVGVCVALATGFSVSCTPEEKRAGLVVAVQTDVAIPKDIDAVRIEVSAYGKIAFSNRYAVGKSGLHIPATLTILPPRDGATPVTIRVISYKKKESRTLRRVVTTVPDSREALLRMPISWLCDGELEADGEDVASSCSADSSCVAGSCAPDKVDSKTLEDYVPGSVFGDEHGLCFDTNACFAVTAPAADFGLDMSSCSLSLAQSVVADGALDPDKLNFGLSLSSGDGICGDFGCYVPLERDVLTGWSADESEVHLPKALCGRFAERDDVELVVSTLCETRTGNIPPCGDWTDPTGSSITVDLDDLVSSGSGGNGPGGAPNGDGGSGTGGNDPGTGGGSSTGGTGTGGIGSGSGGTSSGGASSGGTGSGGVVNGTCGNMSIEGSEGCDDGNFVTGDGCGPDCARVVMVATGSMNTCTLDSAGRVKCWGAAGHLGLGDNVAYGNVKGQMATLPYVDLGAGARAIKVGVGFYHSCALLDDGRVKCWGESSFGQLGLGNKNTYGDAAGETGVDLPAVNLGTGMLAKDLFVGHSSNCVILQDDSVKCWGRGGATLGVESSTNYGDGTGQMGDSLPTVQLGTGRTAKSIAAGYAQTCALLDDNTVKCWGSNSVGALGRGVTGSFGDQAGQMGDNLPVVDLGGTHTAKAISAGWFHTCAILDDDTLKCWGGGSSGQLGNGLNVNWGDGPNEMGTNLPVVDLGAAKPVGISCCDLNCCALLDDQTVKCWGGNSYGQLGYGDTTTRGNLTNQMGTNLGAVSLGTGRHATGVSMGYGYACALLDDLTLKCWGSNAGYPLLGLEDNNNRGDVMGEMGDGLPAVLVP